MVNVFKKNGISKWGPKLVANVILKNILEVFFKKDECIDYNSKRVLNRYYDDKGKLSNQQKL